MGRLARDPHRRLVRAVARARLGRRGTVGPRWVCGTRGSPAPVLLVLAVVAGLATAMVPVRPLPVWSATLLVVLSLAAVAWAGVTHSEQVLPRRDSGLLPPVRHPARVRARATHRGVARVGRRHRTCWPSTASPWRVRRSTRPAPRSTPASSRSSRSGPRPGTPSRGGSAAPRWPWAPAILFGLTVLGVGLLASTVVGPRWGPLAALGTGLLFPLVHVARSTYSEPVALPVLAAGLLTMVLAARSARVPDIVVARRTAVVAGVLMGGAVVIRVDALREAVLVVPVVVLAALQRQAHARALGVATASRPRSRSA